MEKTYLGWREGGWISEQTEYTEPADLLAKDGTLLTPGWSRHDVFRYDRNRVKPVMHRKEWDFYQISDGHYMVQLSFANISFGGYIQAALVDLIEGKPVVAPMSLFVGGRDKYVMPANCEQEAYVDVTIGGARFIFDTKKDSRRLYFKKGEYECDFTMDIMPGLENITTVLPFDGYTDRYFMTTKQNCMPTEGWFRTPGKTYEFSKPDCFTVLDWGRVCTPYSMVWYWGNGSKFIKDEDGNEHLFGFEITWGIGNEENATETAIFWDGKVHKFGPVDVEVFPKPDKYMEPWHFVSQDGRFDMTMQPFFDNHGDTNALVLRMHCHQVHGLWSGTVILDDGRKVEIKDMYAFCEYCENRW